MPKSGSSGITRVDIPALREVESQGRTSVAKFRKTLDKMENAVNASESFWEGDAAELYRSVFRREMSSLRQAFEEFATYTNDLQSIADTYEHVDSQATRIAAEAQQAVWAEV